MTNVERFNYMCDSHDWESMDVFKMDGWTVTKEYIVDEKGKRVPHTTVFMIFEGDEGDCPPYETFREAKADLLKMVKGG